MRKFAAFLILLLLLVALTSLLVTFRYPAQYPYSLGPEFDDRLRVNHRDYLDAERPSLILIGDSTLRDSVDFKQLQQELGISIYEMASPGSSTALWYLVLKNNIILAEHKPDYLVLFTRETMLTTPEYRVTGGIFLTIDEYAGPDEPLLLERSFLQKMSPLERLAARYLPVYGQRAEVRSSIDYRINHTLPVLFQCGEDCVSSARQNIFSADVDMEAIQEAQDEAENYLWEMDKLLFQRQLPRSYLPEIVRMTRENDIQLILVEMKTWKEPPSTTIALLRRLYQRDLQAYADANDILTISFANDPRLTPDLFPDGFHLAKEAVPFFTHMLVEALQPMIQQ
jgi:hypothetical protein